MNNDLISREALKKVFNGYHSGIGSQPKFTLGACLQLIDNAPTVEYTFEEAFQKTVCENRLYCPERPKGKWIPVSERLPEEKINPKTNDLEEVLCTTIWGDVRHYKYGKPIGHDEAHFWYGWGIMDKDIIAWQPLPEPYKKGEAE